MIAIDVDSVEQRLLEKAENRRWDKIRRDAVQIYCALLAVNSLDDHRRLMNMAVSEALDLETLVVEVRVAEVERMVRLRFEAERAEMKRLPR